MSEHQLCFTEGAEEIWSKLKSMKRTGWVQWGIPNPETVYEHVMTVKKLTEDWKDEMSLSEDEHQELLKMIEVHDWPEVLTGDRVILGDELDASEQLQNKKDAESRAMKKLCAEIPDGKEIYDLYDRYENSEDVVAQHCRQLEKFQAIMLALEYERKYHKKGITSEFLKYSNEKIKIPFLVEKMRKVAWETGFSLWVLAVACTI